jgi:hypothetical protein
LVKRIAMTQPEVGCGAKQGKEPQRTKLAAQKII